MNKKINHILTLVESMDTLTDKEKEMLTNACNDKSLPTWLITLLKVVAYALGLVLAGYGTANACEVFNVFNL